MQEASTSNVKKPKNAILDLPTASYVSPQMLKDESNFLISNVITLVLSKEVRKRHWTENFKWHLTVTAVGLVVTTVTNSPILPHTQILLHVNPFTVLKFIGEKCGDNVYHSQLPHVWSCKPPLRKPLGLSWILQIPLLLYCPEVEKPALRTPRQDVSLEKQEFLLLSWDNHVGWVRFLHSLLQLWQMRRRKMFSFLLSPESFKHEMGLGRWWGDFKGFLIHFTDSHTCCWQV